MPRFDARSIKGTLCDFGIDSRGLAERSGISRFKIKHILEGRPSGTDELRAVWKAVCDLAASKPSRTGLYPPTFQGMNDYQVGS